MNEIESCKDIVNELNDIGDDLKALLDDLWVNNPSNQN